MKPRTALLSLILLAAACARTEDASVRPAESNESYSAVERVREGETDELEPALGEWRPGLVEDRPALEFGSMGTAPLLSLVCGERGGLVIRRAGILAPGAAPNLTVTIDGQGRQLPVTAVPGPAPATRASISPGDTLVRQMSVSQSPIALRFGDGTPLVLPPSSLIGEFAQSCSSGRGGAVAASPRAENGQQAAEAPEEDAANEAAAR